MGFVLFLGFLSILFLHLLIAQEMKRSINRYGLRVWHIVVMIVFLPFTIISWIGFKISPILDKPIRKR